MFLRRGIKPKMLTILEAIIIFATSFGINVIPFFGPSNIFIASLAAIKIDNTNVFSVLIIGALVALGATMARIIHYKVTPLISKHLSEQKRATLESNASKINKQAFLILCLTAATLLPEEPIIISLAAMKYNLAKFATAFFLGKLSIATISAFAGNAIGNSYTELLSSSLPTWISPDTAITIMSTCFAIIVTVILLKVDLGKVTKIFKKRLHHHECGKLI
jgi:membrane protein YqaA with SNARE-associated domain